MADFSKFLLVIFSSATDSCLDTQPADLVPVRNEGRVLVYKNEDRTSAKARAVRVPLAYTLGPVLKAMVKKMVTLAGMSHILTSRFLLTICCHLDSDNSLWVKDDWEMKGPFAVAVQGDEPIEWNNNKEMELLMVSKIRLDLKKFWLYLTQEPSIQGSGFYPPPSPSVYSAAAPLTISSLAPSASVSTAGVDTASLTIAQQLASAFSDLWSCPASARHLAWHPRHLAKARSLRSLPGWRQLP